MLEQRLIGETAYSVHDTVDKFLIEADRVRPKRVLSYTEDGSGKYELIAGFVEHSKSTFIYLAPEPLAGSPFGRQQRQFQQYLSEREISLLRGRIEVAAGGEILQFFAKERDWSKAVNEETDQALCFVEYCGERYLAVISEGIYFLTKWAKPLEMGTVLRRFESHSDLGL